MLSGDKADASSVVNDGAIKRVLGPAVAKLVNFIARGAHERDRSLYLVGGVVRDVILGSGKPDLDFVLESPAIEFAAALAGQFGGKLNTYPRFGTATWILDEVVAGKLSLPYDEIPHRIDFVTARSEQYIHATALPTVRPGDIEQDLERRDFSINALALQLSPKPQSGRLIDISGGLADLNAGLIRVLHDRSFVDDPTRILRAIRFSVRLGFAIESQTAQRMQSALPLLGRVSGPRLRNEIDLILREQHPAEALLRLQNIGALENILPDYRLSNQLPAILARCDEVCPPWAADAMDRRLLKWCLLFHDVGENDARSFCEQLKLTNAMIDSVVASARLRSEARQLKNPDMLPSQATQMLDNLPESAVHAAWLGAADEPTVQELLANYMIRWRYQRATISGNDLKTMGVPPGPIYRCILDQLRYAWIDGELASADEELKLLHRLLAAEQE